MKIQRIKKFTGYDGYNSPALFGEDVAYFKSDCGMIIDFSYDGSVVLINKYDKKFAFKKHAVLNMYQTTYKGVKSQITIKKIVATLRYWI